MFRVSPRHQNITYSRMRLDREPLLVSTVVAVVVGRRNFVFDLVEKVGHFRLWGIMGRL